MNLLQINIQWIHLFLRFPFHDQPQVEELLLSAQNQGNSWGGKIHIHVVE